ncbi:MAG: heavy metal-associated domain-containing protein [Acholeplasma sp.]
MKTTVFIEGMHCNNCAAKVEKTLGTLEGVKSAKVNLKKGMAVLKTKDPLDHEAIQVEVAGLGYKITTIT